MIHTTVCGSYRRPSYLRGPGRRPAPSVLGQSHLDLSRWGHRDARSRRGDVAGFTVGADLIGDQLNGESDGRTAQDRNRGPDQAAITRASIRGPGIPLPAALWPHFRTMIEQLDLMAPGTRFAAMLPK